jgi:transposase
MQTQFEELTDAQWQVIKEILKDNRKRKHNLRDIVNGILEILRTGTQWRNLNHSKLSWQIIYYYFRRWKINGTLERLNSGLNAKERTRQNKEATPSLLCIDSQSIKSVAFVSQDKVIDGNKLINGRKRHLIVDTLGLVWGVVVHAADIHDGTKAHLLIEHCLVYLERMNRIAEAKNTR